VTCAVQSYGERRVTKLTEQYVTNASKRQENIGLKRPKRQKCKSDMAIVPKRKVKNRDEWNLIAIQTAFDKWTI
jgi:hypothetical protein